MSSERTLSTAAGGSGMGWSQWQRTVAVTVAALLSLGLLVAALTPQGRHQLQLSLTHRPAMFTELYLAPQGQIAQTTGATTVVRFGIRSHESQNTDFTYRVILSDGGCQASAQGSVMLRVGEAQNLQVRVDTASMRWTRLEVALVDRPERLTWIRTQTNEVTQQ